MMRVGVSLGAVWLGAGIGFAAEAPAGVSTQGKGLRPVAAFADIKNPARRSAALFAEAGKVLLHPRCVNCHPATDRPLQGMAGRLHEPRVRRGIDGHGVTAMRCAACHTAANYDAVAMPGNPRWALAPASMAWEGRSLTQICEQMKDPARNGGRRLDAIVEHLRSDPLVGWAWEPGIGREPAPGTQAALGALIQDWARTGAVCPGP
jgi:mono/diheme cytochrome c family protein